DVSYFPGGVLAFSRILCDQEIVVVANTNTQSTWEGELIVDYAINAVDSAFRVLFSNKSTPRQPQPVIEKSAGRVVIHEVSGAVTFGPSRVLRVHLQPMELQILGK
ncbi:MAG: alpha-amylase, partial [candidate division KSB1 bacterium]|nr:alpha-amylase [candidate division KSB1 bacterium]